jgi:hypothetical protein
MAVMLPPFGIGDENIVSSHSLEVYWDVFPID